MLRNILTFLVIVSLAPTALAAAVDEISETLMRAEGLYYEAEFTKSIELLLRLDQQLRPQSDHSQEKITVKLQLALGYIGLNDSSEAKAHFRDLFALEPDYSVDPQRFSPKVVALAEQAKAEQTEIRCRTVSTDAERQFGAGNTEAVMRLVASNQAKCSGLAPIAANTADLLFKQGLDAYRKAQISDALQKFRWALQLQPRHELAAQYVELTESKLQLDADRTVLAWRKNFDAGEFVLAAKDYRQLVAVSSPDTVNQVRAEYRKALSGLVESWNRACASNDVVTLEKIRARVTELMPEPSLGEDVLDRLTCTHTGCIQMSAQLALMRLKTRVDPDFPAFVRAQIKVSPVTVRVKTRISETGDVTASEPQGGNAILYNAVRAAVDRWKFSPAIVQGEARCVDTEIPIVISVKEN
jgi:tetratricopeptide (TPR) repeat protein